MNDTINEAMKKRGMVPVSEAAMASGFAVQHIRKLLREGKVEGERVGARQWFVSLASLGAYLGPDVARFLGLPPPKRARR